MIPKAPILRLGQISSEALGVITTIRRGSQLMGTLLKETISMKANWSKWKTFKKL